MFQEIVNVGSATIFITCADIKLAQECKIVLDAHFDEGEDNTTRLAFDCQMLNEDAIRGSPDSGIPEDPLSIVKLEPPDDNPFPIIEDVWTLFPKRKASGDLDPNSGYNFIDDIVIKEEFSFIAGPSLNSSFQEPVDLETEIKQEIEDDGFDTPDEDEVAFMSNDQYVCIICSEIVSTRKKPDHNKTHRSFPCRLCPRIFLGYAGIVTHYRGAAHQGSDNPVGRKYSYTNNPKHTGYKGPGLSLGVVRQKSTKMLRRANSKKAASITRSFKWRKPGKLALGKSSLVQSTIPPIKHNLRRLVSPPKIRTSFNSESLDASSSSVDELDNLISASVTQTSNDKTHESLPNHQFKKPNYTCTLCNLKLACRADYFRHKLNHRIQCETCLLKFRSRKVYEKHVAIKHKSRQTPVEELSCGFCLKKFTNRRLFVIHASNHGSEKCHECSICHQVFGSIALLESHQYIDHWEQDLFSSEAVDDSKEPVELVMPSTCQACNLQVASLQRLAGHYSEKHLNLALLGCEICKEILSPESFKTHFAIHM